ncbi:MAG: DUF4091 domain-containing protein, partial [Abitibacteriaceae bacterium]|nr:DUF4091 domain-containing protein [Abditibacteriaceae bacterium]
VNDDNPKAAVTAMYVPEIEVQPGQPYRLKFAVRTAKPGQTYQVTLNTYDATGTWMSGHNLDINRQGSGAWEQVTVDVTNHLTPQMHFVALNLRPVPWAEDGSGTGSAWFDEISFTGPDGKNLIEDSGFENEVQPAQVKIDFSAFDRAMEKSLAQYHFSAWRIPLEGMGGGTFQARYPGHIGAYAEGTPEYETLFGSYLRQLQDHLEQKGWLNKAYIYWFDEPDTKDYPFVRAGMERIKKYAPKLTRMLTEEPGDALAGAVDLWCPITNNYDPQKAQQRQQAGDRVWWYVCTGPKAPYATLFIDHPAVELRTWLWQTWKYHVQGILVWESTYWTSPAAYPDTLQNPWHDPMSWVSGYGTAPGTKSPWGNGDGRFLYPPNQEVGMDKSKHLEGPVNSIRFEMLREGIEDYEYFYLLRDEIQQAQRKGIKAAAVTQAEQLLQVPAAVTANMTTFATEPQPIMVHREKLAQAIETLATLLNASSATHLR